MAKKDTRWFKNLGELNSKFDKFLKEAFTQKKEVQKQMILDSPFRMVKGLVRDV